MKTIFITCFTGLISRNILATDVLAVLGRAHDLRVVIIAPESRAAILRHEFGCGTVVVEGVALGPLTGRDQIWWLLATHLLRTDTRGVQRLARFARDRNWVAYIGSGLLGFFGSIKFIRHSFRALAFRFIPTTEFVSLFDRYHPDLLFATDVYTPWDVKLECLARRRAVGMVGMIRSWDNVTSKTLLTFIPDTLAVSTDDVGGEVAHYGDVPPQRIIPVGVPHYDRYRSAGRTPRKVFFRKFGFDPARQLILFAPPSDTYLKGDPIAPAVLAALRGIDAQILVRLPLVGATELGGYRPEPNVAFDEPEHSPDFIEAHVSRAADQHLADSIYHADLVITWASTMIVDAVVFGKPVVLVGFDATPRPYEKSITQYYDYDHQQHILATGGVRLTKSPAELAAAVRGYLVDPHRDHAGRERILREFCGPLDGRAGARVANLLLHSL